MRALLSLLMLTAAACKPQPGFDERYRGEAERLEQSAQAMEREAAKSIGGAEQAARAMGEEAGPAADCPPAHHLAPLPIAPCAAPAK